MGANIPSIGNIGDIDLSEAKSKVSSGMSGLALNAISKINSVFGGEDNQKQILSQPTAAANRCSVLVAHNGIALVFHSYFNEMTNEQYAAFGVKNCSISTYTFD